MQSSAMLRIDLFAILVALIAFVGGTDSRPAEDTVRFAAIIHRHGDRSPLDSYPNDPYINYEWPGGKGALSTKGALQLYTLGKTLRKRYNRLLPSDGAYTASRIHVMCSATERTQMSAQSMLAGFMPPLSDRNLLPILWQPIPIHTIPEGMDNLIAQSTPCPKYQKMHFEMLRNPPDDLQPFYQNNARLLSYLTESSGLSETNVRICGVLYDILTVQRDNNMTLPEWTASVFPDQMIPLVEQGFALHTHNELMKLIKGGPLVTKIIYQMLEFKNGNSSRTVNLYSGHDLTLLSVIRLLNLTSETSRLPNYGATLAFELHCDNDLDCSRMEVRIVYYSSFNDKKPTQLTIPNCPEPCMLDQFVDSIDFILDFDRDSACELDTENAI